MHGIWRRGRDSNPRDPFGPNGFQDRRFQPLTHPSVSQFNWQLLPLPTTKTRTLTLLRIFRNLELCHQHAMTFGPGSRTSLIVNLTVTKTIWFNRKDFGCINLPSGRRKRKLLESPLPSVGRAKRIVSRTRIWRNAMRNKLAAISFAVVCLLAV